MGEYHIKLKHSGNNLVINIHSLCQVCTPHSLFNQVDESEYTNAITYDRKCTACRFSTAMDNRYFMVTKSKTNAAIIFCEQHGMELINDL
jgi:hypothetical protein